MPAEGQRRIRALRPFSYSVDGVRLIAVAAGGEVSLRAGAATGLLAEGYAEAVAADPSPRQQTARRRPPVRDPA